MPSQISRILLPISLVMALMLSSLSYNVASEPGYTSEDIRQFALAFVKKSLQLVDSSTDIVTGRLDPRLNLPACKEGPESFLPSGRELKGNTTVGVSCGGEQPWTIYVPVEIQVIQNVVTTARAVPGDVQLTESDLVMRKQNVGKLTGTPIINMADVVGLIPKNALKANMILTTSLLESPTLVKRGQMVTLIASGPGLDISYSAEALEDGIAGETVRVRNPMTKKIISAVVADHGTVRIQL